MTEGSLAQTLISATAPRRPPCGQWVVLFHQHGCLSPWPSFLLLCFAVLRTPCLGPACPSGEATRVWSCCHRCS